MSKEIVSPLQIPSKDSTCHSVLLDRSFFAHTMLVHSYMSTAPVTCCLSADTSRSAPEDTIKSQAVSGDQSWWQHCHVSKTVPQGMSVKHLSTDKAAQFLCSGWEHSCLAVGSANWGYTRQWQEPKQMSVKCLYVLMPPCLDVFPPHIMFPVCPPSITALANWPGDFADRLSVTLPLSCTSQKWHHSGLFLLSQYCISPCYVLFCRFRRHRRLGIASSKSIKYRSLPSAVGHSRQVSSPAARAAPSSTQPAVRRKQQWGRKPWRSDAAHSTKAHRHVRDPVILFLGAWRECRWDIAVVLHTTCTLRRGHRAAAHTAQLAEGGLVPASVFSCPQLKQLLRKGVSESLGLFSAWPYPKRTTGILLVLYLRSCAKRWTLGRSADLIFTQTKTPPRWGI